MRTCSFSTTRLLSTSTRRLASPSVSPSHLPKFPPKESLYVKDGDIPTASFSPTVWATLQPPPPSALSAFVSRIGLDGILGQDEKDVEVILQACTHPSFLHLWQEHHPNGGKTPQTNAQLAATGNSLMGLFATEWLRASYPHLPTRVLKAAVTAHVGPLTCANVAQEMGAAPLLRWHRMRATMNKPALLHNDALASIPRSLTALIYQRRSLPSARQFVQSYFLSREVDIRSMIKFTDPKKALVEMVEKFQREKPKSRLLKETGRYSNAPMFVVGIFCGEEEIGQGFGGSLKMAEYRAAEDALHRVYLTRTPSHLVQIPSQTFPLGLGDVFRQAPEQAYTAPELVQSEIMYASSGKSYAPSSSQSD